MKVLAVRSKRIDLNESPTLEEGWAGESLDARSQVLTGAAVFDDDERLLPLVSGFLSHGLANGHMSYQSALTYGKNLAACRTFLWFSAMIAACPQRDPA